MDELKTEQAIEILKIMKQSAIDFHDHSWLKKKASKDILKAYDMAIKALEQEPCTDAISRSEAIRVASGYCHWTNIPDELAKLPSVNTEKTGRWIDDGFYAEGHSEHAYRCSECDEHYIGYVGEFKYCPNCGARMGVEE